jgi:hypothetical protein
MRSLRWWFGVAVVCSVGCGGDAGSTKDKVGDKTGTSTGTQDEDDAAGDGDGAGAGAGECSPTTAPVLASYDGELKWTLADLQACQTACPPSGDDATDQACVDASCAPGVELFSACVPVELNACLSATDSPCRAQFGAQYCCAVENCDVDAGVDALRACLEESCATERDAYQACGTADEVFEPCLSQAGAACLVASDAPATDAPAPTAPGSRLQSAAALELQLSPQLVRPMLQRFTGRAFQQ